jgi:hypothetical protein
MAMVSQAASDPAVQALSRCHMMLDVASEPVGMRQRAVSGAAAPVETRNNSKAATDRAIFSRPR